MGRLLSRRMQVVFCASRASSRWPVHSARHCFSHFSTYRWDSGSVPAALAGLYENSL